MNSSSTTTKKVFQMSKQITPMQLAHIVTSALIDKKQFDTLKQFENFMTDIAEVVCKHFGGELVSETLTMDDFTSVGIIGNESLPKDGGVFASYDVAGSLWGEEEIQESTPEVPDYYVVTAGDVTPDGATLDAMLEVYFPDLLDQEFEDYDTCEEWNFLKAEASFQHTEVSDLIVHVPLLSTYILPEALKETIQKAKDNNLTWILFHLGN